MDLIIGDTSVERNDRPEEVNNRKLKRSSAARKRSNSVAIDSHAVNILATVGSELAESAHMGNQISVRLCKS
jgi:hypothetical protein